ncbi:HIT family protein [Paraburkholderia sp. CNPSo 3076]|uniref:HIT family protein n=1 Tax=Paraburkholderia sp. CNPSo 3076 TaxID=2940936 RepID=UPI002259928C|nr:HIT family protein [Paraburkholderia sp. CNPSo 3076]MCX5540048.1 HIT family protein [Paraburkholderia sp. CNPSo 3076]
MNQPCPFCSLPPVRILDENDKAIWFQDGFPVSPGHSLLIPKRHVASFFETTAEERVALLALLDQARQAVQESNAPDGFNIGVNIGAAAGQTVPHLHIHLIPRYLGDQEDPRGGVRKIFPEKAVYWDKS